MKIKDILPKTHGGYARGERNFKAKLTDEQVREIKLALKSGVPRQELADKYGAPRERIKAIDIGKTWAWLQV